MRKSHLVNIGAFFITIIFISILLTQISILDIFKTLSEINPLYLILGFILYTGSIFLRAYRFNILLNYEVGIEELFSITCVHNMINNLLPARTGELSYIYLLKKINKRTTGEGVATLIVARIFDFISLSALFFLGVILVNDIPGFIKNALWIIIFFVIFLSVILVTLLFAGRKFVVSIQRTLEKFHFQNNRIALYIGKKGFETVDSLEKIKIKKNVFILMIISTLIWGFNYLLLFLLISAMNFQISYLIVILGGSFILLTSVLPIQGLGGFGTTEAVWTLIFVPLGMPLEEAIISGFCFHIISIVFYLLLGGYGIVKLKIFR